ncbi:uncharacterized protein C1orf105 homolog isoform X2 [Macrotis lagotis]|uniref:uncharacterized protein C1orf105 homolog isoform X2 n=1 Tax=Macrotis lagotis TaxID=92651 RepID=UPI003D6898A2
MDKKIQKVPFKVSIITYDPLSKRDLNPSFGGNKPLIITLRQRPQTTFPINVDTKKDMILPNVLQMTDISNKLAQVYQKNNPKFIKHYPLCTDCLRRTGKLALQEKDSRYKDLPHFIKPTRKMIILDAPKHLQIPLMDFMNNKRFLVTKYKPPENNLNEDIKAENVGYRLPMRAIWGPKKPFQTLYTDLIAPAWLEPYQKKSLQEEKNMWAEFNITKIPKFSKYY